MSFGYDHGYDHFFLRGYVALDSQIAYAARGCLKLRKRLQDGLIVEGWISGDRRESGTDEWGTRFQLRDPGKPALRHDCVELLPKALGNKGDCGVEQSQCLVEAEGQDLSGDIAVVRLKGAEPLGNVPRSVREHGHQVIRLEPAESRASGEDDVYVLTLRKSAGQSSNDNE